MSMNVGSSDDDGDVMVDINTTPLIDVMLVLLIMLIITIPIQTHAVKMNMPQASAEHPPTPPSIIEIVVDFDGTQIMYVHCLDVVASSQVGDSNQAKRMALLQRILQ